MSHQFEIGAIPDEWKFEVLGNLCTFENGDRGKNYPTIRNTDGFGLPFINAGDLNDGAVDTDRAEFISQQAYDALGAGRFKPNDILFCLRGSLGKFAQVTDNVGVGAIASSLIIIRPQSALLCDRFLLAYLASPQCTQNITRWSGGAAQPNLGGAQLQQFSILCPPLTEQEAIASAFKDIDGLIASHDALIVKKRDIMRAAMQQLLTGKTRLPGFNGNWLSIRFSKFAPLQRGFDLPTRQLKPGQYPVAYSNGVLNHHNQFMVKGPGVVTGRSGTIGKITYVEGHFWPHNTALWVTSFENSDPKFVYYYLQHMDLARFATGSGVPTLNRNDVHAQVIEVPASKAEQSAIADVLSDLDGDIAALMAKCDKVRTLREGMMQQLLTGRTRLV